MPGDGLTDGCEHEDGCGYWRNEATEAGYDKLAGGWIGGA